MAGLPYPMRAAGFGVRRPKALNPGRSLTGTVESVGQGVTEFGSGDEVYCTAEGTFAGSPAPKRKSLRRRRDGREQHGQGRPGAALGADHVIDYTRDDVAGGEHRYDVILDDIGGNRRLSHLRRALAPGGTLVIVGDETGGKWIGGFDRGFRAQVLSLFVGQKLGGFMATENTADLTALRDLVESGQAAPAVERTFSLSETPAAVRQVARAGPAQGRHRRVNRVAPTGGRAQS